MKKVLLSLMLLTGYQIQAALSYAAEAKEKNTLKLFNGQEVLVSRQFLSQLKISEENFNYLYFLSPLITPEILQQLQDLADDRIVTKSEVLEYLDSLNLLALVDLYNASNFLKFTKIFTFYSDETIELTLTAILLQKIAQQLIITNLEDIDYRVFQKINASKTFKKSLIEKIYDRAQWFVLHTLEGHTSSLALSRFNSDGQLIVTTSYDNTAKVWKTQTGENLVTLRGHKDSVISASFSPNSKLIATASWDQTAKIWNTQTGKCVATFVPYNKTRLRVIEFSKDGESLITFSANNITKVWNTKTLELIRIIVGILDPLAVYVVDNSRQEYYGVIRDGHKVLKARPSHSNVGDVEIYSFEEDQVVATLPQAHKGLVHFNPVFSPNSQLIVTFSDDKTAKVWTHNFAKAGLTLEEVLKLSLEEVLHVFKTGERPVSKIPAAESKPE